MKRRRRRYRCAAGHRHFHLSRKRLCELTTAVLEMSVRYQEDLHAELELRTQELVQTFNERLRVMKRVNDRLVSELDSIKKYVVHLPSGGWPGTQLHAVQAKSELPAITPAGPAAMATFFSDLLASRKQVSESERLR